MTPWSRRARQRSVEPEVRRLLADARHTEPMPVEVAARLDRVLADLASDRQPDHQPDQQPDQQLDELADRQAERPGGPAVEAPVTDLAGRRRRRAAALLVAAAAVVIVGVGIDRLSSSSSPGSETSTAGRAPGAADQSQGQGARDSLAGADQGGGSAAPSTGRAPQGLPSTGPRSVELTPVLSLRGDHFSADAARARGLAGASQRAQTATPDSHGTRNGTKHRDSASAAPRSAFECQRADWGRGRLVGVRYDHAPAVLVLRAPHGDTQVVDLFRCGSTDLLRSSTLPLH